MDDRQIICVDSQKLSMIQSCAYKYDNVMNKRLIPIQQAFAIERGSLIHHMIETYNNMLRYRDRWSDSKPWNPKAAYTLQDVIKSCIIVGEYHAIQMSIQLEEVEETVKVFKEYIEYWWPKDRYRVLAVEQVGSRVMYEDSNIVIIYETKIDFVTDTPNIGIIPWDTKTYSRRAPINKLDNQFLGYVWMLDVRNIMINKIGFQKTLKPEQKYYRDIVSYQKPVIDSWVENSVQWILHLNNCFKTNTWLQNFTSCQKYNQDCQFMLLCREPKELRGWKASQLYNISTEAWDIGAKL